MGVGDLQVTRASSCRLRSLSSDLCVPSMFSTQGPTSSCVYRAQLIAGVREVHPPWVESQTHHFLMCHQPQWAHSAARADPGAWSPAWSRPGQKRMTARCLQPASDLGIQRHQKPSGPLSGPFLFMRRRKLAFEKLVRPKAGQ